MNRKYSLSILLFCIFSIHSFSQTVLQGNVTESKENVIGAAVLLYHKEVQIKGVATDFDGNYIFTMIKPGTYSIEVMSLGLETQRMNGIVVAENTTTKLDFQMKVEGSILSEIVIKEYKVPLLNFDQSSSVKTVTAEAISSSPLKSVSGLNATSAGLSSDSDGNTSIRGARRNSTNYYVDGIRVINSGKTPENELYEKIDENSFNESMAEPLSTLSIDVDRASYSNMRRFLQQGSIPQKDVIRTEELINYFNYNYDEPDKDSEHPFVTQSTLTECPWNSEHKLLHVSLQGKRIKTEDVPASNFVFLIDVSGSMAHANKLPLLISSFKLLTNQLREEDRIAIVVYAGSSGCVLESTPGNEKEKIITALNKLNSGGSTNGASGINQAYHIAEKNFIKGGNNRVILATDGDFNVGASSDSDLLKLIKDKRKTGVYISVLGFGQGNYNESMMQKIANAGNGNHSYIDNMIEAKKVFSEEFSGTLFTIAKDVKIQIEFNPAVTDAYRMIGYENRILAAEDFNDDTKDAGEMGAGHSVTVLYEIVPKGSNSRWNKKVDPLKYFKKSKNNLIGNSYELATIKCRYKKPDGNKSIKTEIIIPNTVVEFNSLNKSIQWASNVALFGQLLRESKYVKSYSLNQLSEELNILERDGLDKYQMEFIDLVNIAASLKVIDTE